jgi:hypothetical protein
VKEITVVTKNNVGALADVCEALGKVGVNIKAISAQGVGDKGVIRVVTEDDVTARNVLGKAGFKFDYGEVVSVKMKDRPGELAKIARKLAASGVDIESVYIGGRTGSEVEVLFKPESPSKALAALRKA